MGIPFNILDVYIAAVLKVIINIFFPNKLDVVIFYAHALYW